MSATLRILDAEIVLECAPSEQRRLADLAAALEARLAGFSGDAAGLRQLAVTALALMDEAQATGAALARARGEIERLTDMLVEARVGCEPAATDPRGRVVALRAGQGAA